MEGFDQHLAQLRAERERLERDSGFPPFVPRAGDEEGMRFTAPQPMSSTLPYGFSNESDLLNSITQLKDEHAANVRRITELSLSASGPSGSVTDSLSRDYLTSSSLFASAPADGMAGLDSHFLGGCVDPAVAAALAGARLASDTRNLTQGCWTGASSDWTPAAAPAAAPSGWTSQYWPGSAAVGASAAAASSLPARPNFARGLAPAGGTGLTRAAPSVSVSAEFGAFSWAPEGSGQTAVPLAAPLAASYATGSRAPVRSRGSPARAPARTRAGEHTPTAADFEGVGPIVSLSVPRRMPSRPSSARERPRPSSTGRLGRPPASARSAASARVEPDLRASSDMGDLNYPPSSTGSTSSTSSTSSSG